MLYIPSITPCPNVVTGPEAPPAVSVAPAAALLLGLCLDEMGEGQSPSYPELATHTWGSPGRVVAVVFCFLELFGNACMNLIVMWHEVESLMGALPGGGLLGLSVHNSTVLLGVVAIMPLLLTGNLKTLSYLSFVSTPQLAGQGGCQGEGHGFRV